MEQLTQAMVRRAIQDFLTKKLEPETKNLEKAKASNDTKAIAETQEIINKLTDKYPFDNWMADAANRMAKQLKFGSHIAKGVHPDAKGDNINFKDAPTLPEHLIGSQTLTNLELDANGNAAALPLASFFNTVIGDHKLRDLIQTQHPSLKGCFASDETLSDQYAEQFKIALDNVIETPSTSELNKQLLWPQSGAQSIEADDYLCLVPLYPSALTKHLHKTINEARFSEANKQAQKNRWKKDKDIQQAHHLTMPDIAYIKLGGSKPQNVSQLTSSQGGKSLLLPSIPPTSPHVRNFSINKKQGSIFDKPLESLCYVPLQILFDVIKFPEEQKNAAIREQRKEALHYIIKTVFKVILHIQQNMHAGWSTKYELSMSEKYLLDPDRAELEGEEEFKENQLHKEWDIDIEHNFANWLNNVLKKQFPDKARFFNDTEQREWRREIRKAIEECKHRKEGPF